MGKSKSDIHVETEADRPVVVEVKHPVTGDAITLVDPYYRVLSHKSNALVLDTPDSFAAAVKALAPEGGNRLVQLRGDGSFVYRDQLGPYAHNVLSYQLEKHPTKKVLGLDGAFAFGQRDLIRWLEQWPGTLLPDDPQPEACIEELANFKATSIKTAAVNHGEGKVSVSVEADDFADGTDFPRRWFGLSPLYRDHPAQRVTLRMDVKLPEANTSSGNVDGKLQFVFSLWAPAAGEVETVAMAQALEQMAEALDGFTIVRGTVTPAAGEEFGGRGPAADDYSGSSGRRY